MLADEKIAVLCKALCDPENQPHQWVGNLMHLQLEKVINELIQERELEIYGCD